MSKDRVDPGEWSSLKKPSPLRGRENGIALQFDLPLTAGNEMYQAQTSTCWAGYRHGLETGTHCSEKSVVVAKSGSGSAE